MEPLPTSIAAYLEEAGFSGTEILILRRLMDGEPLTIRQLGAKTGKSTGVLDQAMKKLMKKNIIKRTLINDTPKYSLDSFETVVEWMQDDMEQKREMLLRRHQNFESFVTSIEVGPKRPDIEYFEGDSGIKQAYIKLLNGPGEILHYLPVMFKEEEDPLRDFRVQYFRERQLRKMFSRVLAHDTVLGHRYQSRDTFEYRKTVLVPEKEYPFTFEKIITGDRIACIDHKAKTACVIRYPELADVERTLFEAIWRQVQAKPIAAGSSQLPSQEPEKIAFSTEAMSQLREFFLSKKSLVAMGVCGFLSLGLTVFFYNQSLRINTLRIQERVKSIAATAALQFDANDIEQIHTVDDISRPEYAKLVHHLNRIRRENEGVKYAYIMRPTQDAQIWEFVADADALDPFTVIDVNGDGKIDEKDHLTPPGEKYQDSEEPRNSIVRDVPAAYDIYADQWGAVVTGTAPILNENGDPICIIGIDVDAQELHTLVQSQFAPLLYFIGFFALFLAIRFSAYNHAIMKDLIEMFSLRKVSVFYLFAIFVTVVVTALLYAKSVEQRIVDARIKISTIASAGSIGFLAGDLLPLRNMEDVDRPEYASVVRKLHVLKTSNDLIKYAYIIRPVSNSTTFSFIADADAYGFDPRVQIDTNADGKIDGSDEVGYPGLPYDISHIDVLREHLYNTPITSRAPYIDKWGFVFTGYAPIRDQSESIVALLAIDVDAISVYVPSFSVAIPSIVFTLVIAGYVLFVHGFKNSPIFGLLSVLNRKKVLYAACAIGMIAYWIAFSFYISRKNLVQEETGRRLMAIAATAASQIDPSDLDKLRFARDMKTSEYQRVFKKLNEIRETNPDIQWIYVLRPTGERNLWEFVADGDSNYFLAAEDDYDANGSFSSDEENVWPGFKYYYDWETFEDALLAPAFSKSIKTDQWGAYITGAAPIKVDGETVAILGVDISIDDVIAN